MLGSNSRPPPQRVSKDKIQMLFLVKNDCLLVKDCTKDNSGMIFFFFPAAHKFGLWNWIYETTAFDVL